MHQKTFKALVVTVGLIILSFNIYAKDTSTIKHRSLNKHVSSRALIASDKEWFNKEFPRSYMAIYVDKAFVITKEKKPFILTRKHKEEKIKWLQETAVEEFQDYVLEPKSGYKAIAILHENKLVGALLYRLLESEKAIYLAQYFIIPEMQKHGIGYYVIDSIMPSLHPDYKRVEILARHQNDAAFSLYNNLGFQVGDEALVRKYDYDPLRYMGFFKDL